MKLLFLFVLSTLCVLNVNAQMITESNSSVIKHVEMEADFIVCGGGLSGVCAAVSAARHGTNVILIQDRPVLGGNSSSEMRMGIVGVKNDDSQETGILEEMQMRNFYYNPLQRYTLWDDVIYSTVVSEKNIKLLLNTSVQDVVMDGDRISAVKCWNSNAYTKYLIKGKLFADCTGDGILRLSGAKYRWGREAKTEFNESYVDITTPDAKTMGNSLLLQLRKTDEYHPFKAPDWAYHFTDDDFNYSKKKSTIPGVKFNYKKPFPKDNNFWWIEFGGTVNTIFNANDIQYELKRIAYGVWEYMKNHPDGRCRNYDLDWIGSLPGKRWTLDNHDPEAFHKKGIISVEFVAPKLYGIPFDCLYSVNVPNLMFAGRDISTSHMAFSSTRVMATCALLGQAAGTGAALALEKNITPAQVRKDYISQLQAELEDDDVLLPHRWRKPSPLTMSARMEDSLQVLRNGIDRRWEEADNGIWVAPGAETVTYTWKKPVELTGARLIFDSNLKTRSKRMRKLEATTERAELPPMMAKSFRLEARVGGKWQTVYTDEENYLRLRKVTFGKVKADALRLVVTSTWGAPHAHIFAFDAL